MTEEQEQRPGASTEPPVDVRSVLIRARSIINEGTERTPSYECADVVDAIDILLGRAGAASTEATPPPDVLARVYEDGMRAGIIAGWAGQDFEAAIAEVNAVVMDTDTEATADAIRALARASTEATERPDLRAALERLVAAQHVNASVGERMAATTAARAALTGASPSEPSPLDEDALAEAVRRTALDHYQPEASASYAGRLAKHYARIVGAAPEEEREP